MLVGVTVDDKRAELNRHEQYFGRITSAGPARGFAKELHGSRAGETMSLAPGDWSLLQRTARPSLPRRLALAVQGGDWKGIGLMLFMTLLLLFFGRTLWRGSHLARARATSKLVQGPAGEPALHIQSPYRCERWPSGERAKSCLTHRSNAVPTAGHIACKALTVTAAPRGQGIQPSSPAWFCNGQHEPLLQHWVRTQVARHGATGQVSIRTTTSATRSCITYAAHQDILQNEAEQIVQPQRQLRSPRRKSLPHDLAA